MFNALKISLNQLYIMENNNTNPIIQMIMPYVALGVIALIVLYYMKSQVGKATDALGLTQSDEDKKANRDAVQEIAVDAKKLSYPTSRYLTLANNLFNAMEGFGTDADVVKSTFEQMKNQNDWNMLIKNFGTREGRNIFSWVKAEFPQSSTAVMGRYLRENVNNLNVILKNKGIKQNLL